MDTDQRLRQIEEISKNARATWFSLVVALLFCGITLLDVQDRDFFEYGAATKLPLIGVEVPVVGFFLSAPVLVLALYLYLHIYLAKLWRALAPPFAIEGESLEDRVYPWLLSDTALRLRPDAQRRDFGWMSFLISLVLGWLFAPVILAVFWVRSWPYHHEGLTIFLAALVLVSLGMGLHSWMRMYDWMMRGGEPTIAGPDSSRWPAKSLSIGPLAIVAALVLLAVSWARTEGPITRSTTLPLYSADLYRAELVQLPGNWEPLDLAWQTYTRQHRRNVIIEIERDALDATIGGKDGAIVHEAEIEKRLKGDFKERRKAAVARLPKENWRSVDFSRANLNEADLSGLDMREAKMEGAELIKAQMEGVDLSRAQMKDADLSWAQMEGANLDSAEMEGAYLIFAQVEEVNFSRARMKGADLRFAQMVGTNFSGAQMEEANLSRANMERSYFIRSQMEGAYFNRAQMERADLSQANISGAVFQHASIVGANMSTVKGWTQDQFDTAFGDMATRLPDGSTRPTHWAKDEIPLDRAYSLWRKWMIEEMGIDEQSIPSRR